jgi:hypothetical protein
MPYNKHTPKILSWLWSNIYIFSQILKNRNVSYCDFATHGFRWLSQFWLVEWGNCGANLVFHVPMFRNKTNIPINSRRRRSSVACREHYIPFTKTASTCQGFCQKLIWLDSLSGIFFKPYFCSGNNPFTMLNSASKGLNITLIKVIKFS